MSEPQQPPIPSVLPALSASFIIFIVNILINGISFFSDDYPHTEPDLFLTLGISWGTMLLTGLAFDFVVFCQMQRHVIRGEPQRPVAMAATYVVLDLVFLTIWIFIYRVLSTRILIPLTQGSDHPEFVYFLNDMLSTCARVLIPLVSAGLAVLAGGRRATQAPLLTPSSRIWIVQALTLICGLRLVQQTCLDIANIFFSNGYIQPLLLQLIITHVVPLAAVVVIGGGIYACWPRRLQYTAGWGLFLLGVFMSMLALVPTLSFAVVEFVLHWRRQTDWILAAVWPIYALCILLIAALIGFFFRTRKTPVES